MDMTKFKYERDTSDSDTESIDSFRFPDDYRFWYPSSDHSSDSEYELEVFFEEAENGVNNDIFESGYELDVFFEEAENGSNNEIFETSSDSGYDSDDL
jgi:hypothetical protein